MERPAQRYFCNKCGYVGNVDLHSGCGYLAYHLAPFEQNYIDQLERELALLKASPVGAPEGSFNAWWNSDKLLLNNTYRKDSPAYWAWEGWCAALAAAPTPPVSEDRWLPIETAPKDEFVLLAGPSGYTTIETVFATGRMCSDYHVGRWIDHANDDLTDWGFEPTHWMPLPKAPTTQEDKKP